MSLLGAPSVSDTTSGGIAIWNSTALSAIGYPYLKRVDVIDEKVATPVPIPHSGNTYIWIKMPMTQYQIKEVLGLSPNFMYDQQKKLLVIRSKCLNCCISLAALICMYSNGKVGMYQIYNYSLLKKYFVAGTTNKKQLKKFKKLLKSHTHAP